MEDETPVSLMNKPVNDLTVGDALKVNLVIVAAMVAVPVVIGGASALTSKIRAKLEARKDKKSTPMLTEVK